MPRFLRPSQVCGPSVGPVWAQCGPSVGQVWAKRGPRVANGTRVAPRGAPAAPGIASRRAGRLPAPRWTLVANWFAARAPFARLARRHGLLSPQPPDDQQQGHEWRQQQRALRANAQKARPKGGPCRAKGWNERRAQDISAVAPRERIGAGQQHASRTRQHRKAGLSRCQAPSGQPKRAATPAAARLTPLQSTGNLSSPKSCLLYTSDAADE